MAENRIWIPLPDRQYTVGDGNEVQFEITDEGHTVLAFSSDVHGPYTISLHFEDKIRLCTIVDVPAPVAVPVSEIRLLIAYAMGRPNELRWPDVGKVEAWLDELAAQKGQGQSEQAR